MADQFELMRMQKEHLLQEWMRAQGAKKAEIMVRIMDIEEQLEVRAREEEARKIV